ncbi:MAG TPA: LamG-like jellyroll fold domain-containing protein [Flavobacteriaceae bacterium]|nr:LamG-like jellyroll fold domain-containing protein [Flavobacteriaceae bacterium]
MKTILSFLLILSISVTHAQDIDSDLVMKIDFSNEVADLTGNSTALLSGMETFAEDRNGNAHCAVAFSGQTDEFIALPVNAVNQLVQGDIFSVSLWFKMNNTLAGNYEVLFQKGGTPTSGFEMSVYDMNTPLIGDNTYGLGIWDNDWNQDPTLYNDTENWHHFVMVLDGSSVKLYRDNVLRNSMAYSGDEFNIGDNIVNFEMGRGFIGFLDDVRLYKRALTAQEVGMLFNLPGSCESLNVQNFKQTNIRLFRSGSKSIEFQNLPDGKLSILLFDVTGKKVFESENISTENNSIFLGFLEASVYFVKIKNSKGEVSNHKFILW